MKPTDNKYYVTEKRLDELKVELERYKTVRRREVAQSLREAKDLGDLSENSAYDEARIEQERVELHIGELEDMVKHAIIITKQKSDVVTIGASIVVKKRTKEFTYEIVGSEEADPTAGKISNSSPLGQAFLGKKVGDKVTVMTPAGEFAYEIVQIS